MRLNGHMTTVPSVPIPLPETEISGHGLVLRPLRPGPEGDARHVLRGMADPEFQRWNTPVRPLLTLDDAQGFIERTAERRAAAVGAVYAVTDREDGRFLGQIGLNEIVAPLREGRVGYWILPEERGKKVASRALALLSHWAFTEGGLHRLELGHAIGHAASCRIAERAGFLLEGHLRGAMFAEGTRDDYRDVHLHARLAADPEPEGWEE